MKPGQTCPTCKQGKLREINGKYGLFLGCTKYPSCVYVFREIEKKNNPRDDETERWLKENNLTIDPII